MTSTPAPADDPPLRWYQRLAHIVAVLGIIGGLGYACEVSSSGAEGSPPDESGQVQVACKSWVEDRLKAPSTADFSGVKTALSGDRYTVTGSVDSQNSFGAMIRTSWICTATHANERSTLVSLDFL